MMGLSFDFMNMLFEVLTTFVENRLDSGDPHGFSLTYNLYFSVREGIGQGRVE